MYLSEFLVHPISSYPTNLEFGQHLSMRKLAPNGWKRVWIQSALEEVHGLVQATTTKLIITLDPIGYRVHGRRGEQRMHAMPQGRLELDIWGAFCDSELARDRGFANEFWFPNVLLESW